MPILRSRIIRPQRYKICQLLVNLYSKYSYLKDSGILTENDKRYFDRITIDMNDGDATLAIYQLSDFLSRYYGKKVIILLDEYAASFGFTEEEVFAGMDEFGYTDKATVKRWNDGFIFGHTRDIYNPWSIEANVSKDCGKLVLGGESRL